MNSGRIKVEDEREADKCTAFVFHPHLLRHSSGIIAHEVDKNDRQLDPS
jgi:hypothetical protein